MAGCPWVADAMVTGLRHLGMRVNDIQAATRGARAGGTKVVAEVGGEPDGLGLCSPTPTASHSRWRWRDERAVAFPTGSSGARPPPPTRSKAPWAEDERGPSIWDTFCHTPGKV